jgi:general stress protein YciG
MVSRGAPVALIAIGGFPMAIEDRGFASMDREKQREIASKGGKAAHKKGSAHKWTSDEAREAGRKGGLAGHKKATPETQTASAPQAHNQFSA